MKNTYSFSVIIPTYNRSSILLEAIESVLSQKGNFDFEIFVIDDGSTDNTKEVVVALKNARIHYLHQNNEGPSSARNYGLSLAKNNWIVYLDSDNKLYTNYFEVVSETLGNYSDALYVMVRSNKRNYFKNKRR